MSELTIWTYDWAPEGPRGFVRDLTRIMVLPDGWASASTIWNAC
jgi:hypothetical protein